LPLHRVRECGGGRYQQAKDRYNDTQIFHNGLIGNTRQLKEIAKILNRKKIA